MPDTSPPTTPSRREAAAKEKKQKILAAALSLFASRGFHGTAVPDVADLAGVGAGTIYRYFENKEDLVNAVFCDAKNSLKNSLLENIDLTAELRLVFRQFWQQLTLFAQQHPTEFHFLELQDHAPYLDQSSRNLELEVLAPIWAYCVQGRQQGKLRDMPAEALMALVWGAFVGLMKAQTLGYIEISEETLTQAEEACWQMLIKSA